MPSYRLSYRGHRQVPSLVLSSSPRDNDGDALGRVFHWLKWKLPSSVASLFSLNSNNNAIALNVKDTQQYSPNFFTSIQSMYSTDNVSVESHLYNVVVDSECIIVEPSDRRELLEPLVAVPNNSSTLTVIDDVAVPNNSSSLTVIDDVADTSAWTALGAAGVAVAWGRSVQTLRRMFSITRSSVASLASRGGQLYSARALNRSANGVAWRSAGNDAGRPATDISFLRTHSAAAQLAKQHILLQKRLSQRRQRLMITGDSWNRHRQEMSGVVDAASESDVNIKALEAVSNVIAPAHSACVSILAQAFSVNSTFQKQSFMNTVGISPLISLVVYPAAFLPDSTDLPVIKNALWSKLRALLQYFNFFRLTSFRNSDTMRINHADIIKLRTIGLLAINHIIRSMQSLHDDVELVDRLFVDLVKDRNFVATVTGLLLHASSRHTVSASDSGDRYLWNLW